MSRPSNWPLPPDSVRHVAPRQVQEAMARDPLCRALYPIGMGHYRQARGHRMQRPQHDDHLLLYCCAGEGSLRVGPHADNELTVRTGDVVMLPSGLAHRYHAQDANPWTVYWVHFLGSHATDYTALFHQHGDSDVCFQLGVHPALIAEFEQLLASRHGSATRPDLIAACSRLRVILSDIAKRLPTAAQATRRGAINVEELDAFMHQHVAEPLTLDDFAAHCRVSRFHLVKRYRELSGNTPIKRFIDIKMARSCHLLDTTPDPVRDIAAAVGYPDPCYFSRCFKRVMGISPSAYRGRQRALY